MPDFGVFATRLIATLMTPDRWPLWACVTIFAAGGVISSEMIFTRERAYNFVMGKALPRKFWWHARELQVFYPFLCALLLGYVWVNPEGKPWGTIGSVVYFEFAAALSLVPWVWIRTKMKLQKLRLPGASDYPAD